MKIERKKLIPIIVVAAIIVVIVIWRVLSGSGGGSDSGVFVQPVSDVNYASSTQMAGVNHYSGVVETQKTEKVDFDSTKRLDELFVKEGQHVQKGDALFSYDTQSTSLDIEQKNLEIEQLETNISNNTTQISELQKSMNGASSSDKVSYSAQILQMQAEVAQAQYDIETKKNEIVRLQSQVENATVTAPMAGTIDSIADIDTGSGTVTEDDGESYGDSSNDGNTYITIVGDGDMRVKGTISEQNIAELSVNMEVIVRSRVDETITWNGTISSIDTQAQTENNDDYYMSSSSQQDSNYSFYVNLENVDGLILGQHVTVEPDYGQSISMEGMWLDEGYIQVDDDGNSFVWATSSDGGRLEKRTVEVGAYNEDYAAYEIVSGLADTDYIAWPDDTCAEGVKTTTTFVMSDVDMGEDYEFDDMEDIMIDDAEGMGEDVVIGDMEEMGEDVMIDDMEYIDEEVVIGDTLEEE